MLLLRSHLVGLWIAAAVFLCGAVAGCAPFKRARVATVALTVQDVARAASRQSDLTVVREGTPAYLMLMDGLVEASPTNEQLLTGACESYSAYASTFLEDEDGEKTRALYRKAKGYGFQALSVSTGADFAGVATGSLEEFKNLLRKLDREDVPELFCATNAWASWISTNINDMEALADLPYLEAAIRRVLELDGSYQYGSPHVLMGVYMAARPAAIGGNLEEAGRQFERAFALGAGKVLMSRVLFAQYYARGLGDRELFVNTLQEVLAAQADEIPELTLTNVVAKEKAKRLLDKTEEYFEEPFEETS